MLGDLSPAPLPDLGDPMSPVCPWVEWGHELVHPCRGPWRAAAPKHGVFGQHLRLVTRLVRAALMLQAPAARTAPQVASPAMRAGDVGPPGGPAGVTAGTASGGRAGGVPEPFAGARGAIQPSPGAGSKPKPLTLVCHPGPWGGSSSGHVASLGHSQEQISPSPLIPAFRPPRDAVARSSVL